MVRQRNRRGGRFFGRRVNLEYVPLLPAGAVRWVLLDPRDVPYLLVWRSERDGEAKDAVRVARCGDPGPFYGPCRDHFSFRGTFRRCSWVTVKRPDGRCDILRAVWLPLPRNGAEDLLIVCLGCDSPRRYLYGWEASGAYTNSAEASHWFCRSCARLRYASEGGYLRPGRYLRAHGSLPRPQPWFPYLFTSIHDTRLDEILRVKRV
jgi:hypothetical protein